MSGGLDENDREQWVITEPADVHHGWRVTLVEEADGLYLEAYDENGQRLDSLVLEPYLLDAYVLTFKQAAYHSEEVDKLPREEQANEQWERVLNPFDDEIGVEYYMTYVDSGLYELGTRDEEGVEDRVQISAAWLVDFARVLSEVNRYYHDWVLGDSGP
jgi:hypothetical protein